MHDVPSWAVAAVSILIGSATTWASFKALVTWRLAAVERRVDKLEKHRERDVERELDQLASERSEKHRLLPEGEDE